MQNFLDAAQKRFESYVGDLPEFPDFPVKEIGQAVVTGIGMSYILGKPAFAPTVVCMTVRIVSHFATPFFGSELRKKNDTTYVFWSRIARNICVLGAGCGISSLLLRNRAPLEAFPKLAAIITLFSAVFSQTSLPNALSYVATV